MPVIAADDPAAQVTRNAYAAELSNDFARRQWQHDLQKWALNSESNRMKTIGSPQNLTRPPRLLSLFFRPTTPDSALLSQLATEAAPREPKEQKLMLALYASMVDAYNADPRVARYFLPQARLVFLQAAFRLFNGSALSDASAGQFALQALAYEMSKSPRFAGFGDAEKQAVYERYVVGAASFSLGARWAVMHHDRTATTKLRQLAGAAIAGDLGRDPATLRLDQLPCIVYPFAGLSCEAELRLMQGGR